MKKIVLGVSGSISAYKAADIANRLTKKGYDVHCVLTKAGSEFITALTLETLSKNRVHDDLFSREEPRKVEHISLAEEADLILLAPASADLIAKMAVGLADDLLTSLLLAADPKKVVIAPAMNVHMYENPLTQRNLRVLQKLGMEVIEPREGHLACGDTGRGALAEVDVIVQYADERLTERTV